MAMTLDEANYNRTSDFIILLCTVLQVSDFWLDMMYVRFCQNNIVNFFKFTV